MPGSLNVAVVFVMLGSPNVTVPGPLTLIQVVVATGDARPSSVTAHNLPDGSSHQGDGCATIHNPQGESGSGHAADNAGRFILDKRPAPRALEQGHAPGPIRSHAGEDHPKHTRAGPLRGGLKQGVNRRPHTVQWRSVIEGDPELVGNPHMPAARGYVSCAGLQELTVSGL